MCGEAVSTKSPLRGLFLWALQIMRRYHGRFLFGYVIAACKRSIMVLNFGKNRRRYVASATDHAEVRTSAA